jgi:type II secretory pathway pseudopilin PulG
MDFRSEAGLTWVEVLVATAVFGVLFLLVLPSNVFSGGCIVKGQETQTLSNMKQLHLATQSMALDYGTTRDKIIRGWPGDTGGSFTNWAHQVVPSYLNTNDFCKLLSAPEKTVPTAKLPASMSESAVLVYAVGESTPGDAVFLTTANFTNGPHGGAPLQKSAKPYGAKSFVVFRKGGDGAILKPNQATNANLIGAYAPLCK